MGEVAASGALHESDLPRWNAFRADPARWLDRADAATAQRIWRAMEAHTVERSGGDLLASELNVTQFIPEKTNAG